MANGDVKMVQEGFVLDLTNPGTQPSVSGNLVVTDGFVGMWNESAIMPDKTGPVIVNGVVEVSITTGATPIVRGTRLSIDSDTNQLSVSAEPASDADADDGDLDNDTVIYFGRAVTRVPANTTRRAWVKIKPQ